MSEQIPFISWVGHGGVSLAQPAQFSSVDAYAYVLEADAQAMQKLVDQLLNPAAGPQVHYTVISPFCLVSFMAMAQCRSLTENIGWIPGHEAAWWMPLLEVDHRSNSKRLVMWSPYIFIDYTIGMVSGREVWGWTKSLADIQVQLPESGPWTQTCKTTTFRTLSPDTPARHEVLFQVTAQQPVHLQDWHDPASELDTNHLLDRLFPGDTRALARAFDLGPVPAIALKQFRDPARWQNSCYQAIVESPLSLSLPRKLGFAMGSSMGLSLGITHCESHQLMQDFFGCRPPPGQGSSTLAPLAMLWMNCAQMTALDGSVIVQS